MQTQKGMFLVICHTFCMVDRTVKCYDLARGKIFHDPKDVKWQIYSPLIFHLLFLVCALKFWSIFFSC